jgi:hypothetical protein
MDSRAQVVPTVVAALTGRPTTKSQGAAWALARLDEPWHELIRRAVAVRSGETVAADDGRLRTALPAMARALARPEDRAACRTPTAEEEGETRLAE